MTLQINGNSLGETGAVALNSFRSPYTVTIKPNAATTATISGTAAAAALIKLNGADRVIVDGSNSGGKDRSLTITNTGTTANTTAISLISLGVGQGATNNTIKNLNISNGSSSVTSYGISIGGATPASNGSDNDDNTIQNNSITGVSVGVYAYGTANTSAGGNDNLTVTENTITTNTTSTTLNMGIQTGNALNADISKNTLDIYAAATGQPVGISLEAGVNNSNVSKNVIKRVYTNGTGGYGGRGITVGTGMAASNLLISNNFIYGVNGNTNYSAFSNSSAMGIAIGVIGNGTTLTTVAGGVSILHNTINMTGTHSYTAATLTADMYIGTGASALDIRNNIFVNSLENITTAGSKNYGIYSAAASSAFTSLNTNDYYGANTAKSTFNVGYIGGADKLTLADWQSATGKGANSLQVEPKFVSATDLHLIPAYVNIALNNKGTFVGTVPTDIDGDTRNTTTADIGADEWSQPAGINVGISAITNPVAASCHSTSESLVVAITNYSDSTHNYAANPVTITTTVSGAITAGPFTTTINTSTINSVLLRL